MGDSGGDRGEPGDESFCRIYHQPDPGQCGGGAVRDGEKHLFRAYRLVQELRDIFGGGFYGRVCPESLVVRGGGAVSETDVGKTKVHAHAVRAGGFVCDPAVLSAHADPAGLAVHPGGADFPAVSAVQDRALFGIAPDARQCDPVQARRPDHDHYRSFCAVDHQLNLDVPRGMRGAAGMFFQHPGHHVVGDRHPDQYRLCELLPDNPMGQSPGRGHRLPRHRPVRAARGHPGLGFCRGNAKKEESQKNLPSLRQRNLVARGLDKRLGRVILLEQDLNFLIETPVHK